MEMGRRDFPLHPSRADLLASLKACADSRDVKRGQRVHAQIVRIGLLERDPSIVGTSLVNLYAKCGLLSASRRVLDALPGRDVVAWTAMIAGYVQQGQSEEALKCFAMMQSDDGVSPDAITFVYLLKACANLKDSRLGQEMHLHIRQRSLHCDARVCAGLVDMYARCGFLGKAKEVFDEIHSQDAVLWTSLIEGCLEHGQYEEAFASFVRMQLEGMSLDAFTLVCGMRSCGNAAAMKQGQQIHARIECKVWIKVDPFIGNALVSMYARCGQAMSLAERAFDSLPVRDVISWTTFIGGYVERRCFEAALQCFEQMQLEGISPNDVTFMYILKVCENTRAIGKGRRVHARIKMETQLFIGNALVDMYARSGSMTSCHEVFDNLCVRDAMSWTGLVAGYYEHGDANAAWNCFCEMRLEGVAPSTHTMVCILRVCGSTRDIGKGLEIHAQIEKRGWINSDVAVGAALLDMFTECGLLSEASKLFETLPCKDVVSWTTLIGGFIRRGHANEALRLFDKMRAESVDPDGITFVYALKACGTIRDIGKVNAILVEVERRGLFATDPMIGAVLVEVCFECGFPSRAREAFERLPVRSALVWTALVAGYAEHGHGDEALRSLKQMQIQGFSPGALALVKCLKACGDEGSVEKCRQLHLEIEQSGWLGEDDACVGRAVVDMYGKLGFLTQAKQALEDMPVQDVGLWNSLISSYAECGRDEEALACFEEMQMKGIAPDSAILTYALKAGASLRIRKGRELHARAQSMDLPERDIYTGSALVGMYAGHGMLAEAQAVFGNVQIRNVVLWTVCLCGYVKLGHCKEALELLELMRFEGVLPNAATYVCVVQACCGLGAVQKLLELHGEVESVGWLVDDVELGNAFIDAYAKSGALIAAQRVFDKLRLRTVVSWNALLGGYAYNGRMDEFCASFSRMVFEHIELDAVTFVLALGVCNHLLSCGDEHGTLVEHLAEHFGAVPSHRQDSGRIRCLCQRGDIDGAVRILESSRPCLDDTVTWRVLLRSCTYYGKFDIGAHAFEQTLTRKSPGDVLRRV